MIKYNIDLPLDSPERTIYHKEIILKKKFLKNLYTQWYAEFLKEIPGLPEGKLVELGSGGGFLKELNPNIICSDIINLPTNDITFSALEMPFEDRSLSAIFMVDTFHHIPDSEIFLKEVSRVLKKDGKMVMIEPANSLWGRFIYKNFHHEPFNPKGSWQIPLEGPLTGANGALPWIVFEKDQPLFEKKFPELKIESITYKNPFLYLISGGVSYRQLMPNFTFPMFNTIDKILPKICKHLSMFVTIKITRI